MNFEYALRVCGFLKVNIIIIRIVRCNCYCCAVGYCSDKVNLLKGVCKSCVTVYVLYMVGFVYKRELCICSALFEREPRVQREGVRPEFCLPK